MGVFSARQHAGFTIVELVMVIVLIAILSIAAIPLFVSKDNFSARIASELLVSHLQLAQRVALGMSAQTSPASVELRADTNNWYFSLLKTGQAPYEVEFEYGSAQLSIDGANLSAGGSHTFTWDSAANLSPYQNHQIRIQTDQTYLVCLSASGFAYVGEGACL